MTAILELEDVVAGYVARKGLRRITTPVTKAISLRVAAGETLAIVGESGSGKTTLTRVCLGLAQVLAGRVLFDGQPIGPRRGGLNLSAVMQHPEWAMNPRLTIGQSLAEPLEIRRDGTPGSRKDRVARMLDRVGLPASHMDRFPHQVSGGQRQRASVARAIITTPRFIVFDEAVSALDVSVQTQVLNLIRDLQAQMQFGALFVTHDLAAARYVAQRIAVLKAGEIVEEAPSADFYHAPTHPYSRALWAAMAGHHADG